MLPSPEGRPPVLQYRPIRTQNVDQSQLTIVQHDEWVASGQHLDTLQWCSWHGDYSHIVTGHPHLLVSRLHPGHTLHHQVDTGQSAGFVKATLKCDLLKHIKAVHEGVKYPCTQCKYNASRKSNLLQHIQSIHEGVKFPCTQCEYKATQKTHLMTHIKSIHEGVNFPCSQCEYKATSKRYLLRHIKSSHVGERW